MRVEAKFEWRDHEGIYQSETINMDINTKDVKAAEKISEMLHMLSTCQRPTCLLTNFSAHNVDVED